MELYLSQIACFINIKTPKLESVKRVNSTVRKYKIVHIYNVLLGICCRIQHEVMCANVNTAQVLNRLQICSNSELGYKFKTKQNSYTYHL